MLAIVLLNRSLSNSDATLIPEFELTGGYCADTGLPFETVTVDNLEPRLVAGLIGRDPIVAFKEMGEEGDETDDVLQKWWNDELRDVVKVNGIARNIVQIFLY